MNMIHLADKKEYIVMNNNITSFEQNIRFITHAFIALKEKEAVVNISIEIAIHYHEKHNKIII